MTTQLILFLNLVEYCILQNTNYAGHGVGTTEKTDSWRECSARCNRDAKCFAWSYVTKNHPTVNYHRNCHLKDSTYHERKTASEGVLSGAKGCGMGK